MKWNTALNLTKHVYDIIKIYIQSFYHLRVKVLRLASNMRWKMMQQISEHLLPLSVSANIFIKKLSYSNHTKNRKKVTQSPKMKSCIAIMRLDLHCLDNPTFQIQWQMMNYILLVTVFQWFHSSQYNCFRTSLY